MGAIVTGKMKMKLQYGSEDVENLMSRDVEAQIKIDDLGKMDAIRTR